MCATPLLAVTAWQLLVGGGVLTVAAGLVEGAPPALGAVVAGQRLTLAQAVGIALVLVGILATSRARTSVPRVAPEPVAEAVRLVGARA